MSIILLHFFSFEHICNRVCDCPQCQDESICSKLLCPGFVLIEQIGSAVRCSTNVAALKHSMNLRQVIHRKGINITDDFPVFIYFENVMSLKYFILTPEVVGYCEIQYSKFTLNDASIFHCVISVRWLLLLHNGMQQLYDSMFAAMSE